MMKKLVCLGLCLILSGCTSTPVAKNDAERKVNVNVIEVSASTIDEIEEMAIKDVEDTKAKLERERDALSEEITDFDIYTKNVDKVKAYYDDALKQTELLSVRLREYAYKYAELIMNEDVSYKVKYKDLSGIYEYIYEDAGKDMYGIYDKTVKNMYDIYYDGIINMMELLKMHMIRKITMCGVMQVRMLTMIGRIVYRIFMMFGRICSLIFMNSNRI